jgi:type I restriction enzyme S subunit
MKVAMEVLESGFKETEIGLIPEDWEVVKLGEVVNFKIGRTPPRKNKDYWTNGRYYWVSISDMRNSYINNTSEMVSEKAHKEIFKEKLTPAGTLLMSFKLTIGRTAILNVDAYHNEAVISIYPKENKVLKEFLFYYLPAVDYSNLQDKVVKGNTLNTSKLNKILISLPPLEEQKAIANILSTVQNAIEKTEKVINATKQLKKSMMKHLFTYGAVAVDEIDKVKLKESEIGLIPEHWEVVRLGEVAEKMKAGGTPKRSEKRFWGGSIPFILIEDLTKNNLYIKDAREYITEEGLENSNAWIVPENSLLLSMYATIGETAVNLIPVATNQAILGIIPKRDRLNVEFGAYLLKFHSKRLLSQNIQTTQRNVNKGIVENFLIPLPPLEEQQKIANILTTIDQKIQAEEKKKEALQNLFKTLLQQLITGKIRVKKAKT